MNLGASLSIKACRQFGLDPAEVLRAAMEDLGMKRFRLMSYWDELEPNRGSYDFSSLDTQLDLIAQDPSAEVSLCLGLRQPRWPECHPPEWAKQLTSEELSQQVRAFNQTVIERYEPYFDTTITSLQLENEAYNTGIGECLDVSKKRIRAELKDIKDSALSIPVIQTTSNSWTLPLHKPRPDIVGFSIYLYQFQNGKKSRWHLPASLYRLRAFIARRLLRMDVFCHELQAEPWGPRSTEVLSPDEQLALMDARRIQDHVAFARRAGFHVIDLWGLEWWYWLKQTHARDQEWQTVKKLVHAFDEGKRN
jgi:hypothetical protein